MKTLHEIAADLVTDKDDIRANGQSYAHIYERYFTPMREKPLVVVELGVSGGGSLHMWRDYFHNAKAVVGVDIDQNCRQHARPQRQVEVMTCSQESQGVVERIKELGGVDIVIDDASHINELTIKSFHTLWPLVHPSGYYCIEDLGLVYAGDLRQQIARGGWGGMGLNNVRLYNDHKDMEVFFGSMLKSLSGGGGEICLMAFHPMQVLIQKCES